MIMKGKKGKKKKNKKMKLEIMILILMEKEEMMEIYKNLLKMKEILLMETIIKMN